MKKSAILCLISGGIGALAAVVWTDPPPADETTQVQESVAPPLRKWAACLADGGKFGPRTAATELAEAAFTPEEQVHIAVYETVNRSVVHINTRAVTTDRYFFIKVPSEGEGSGTVLDDQGHILTNYHVVENAREIRVTLFDGSSYEAHLVGRDAVTDVAVLRIDAPSESLHPVVFGDSTTLRVGQRVYAIGNPFGLERTLSTGIVSSLNRSLPSRQRNRTIKSIIQIDAAINPGNSGGPLLDTRGRMIGINTAIASRTGESAGVGFAIPVSTIARIVPQLITTGRVVRPEIGIARVYQTERGLLIADLIPGGPAEQAGLRGPRVVREQRRQGSVVYEYRTIDRTAADLIVAIDDEPVRTADDFLDTIESRRPGEEVTLTVIRQGREIHVDVVLAAAD